MPVPDRYRGIRRFLRDVSGGAHFVVKLVHRTFTPPYYFSDIREQLYFLGVGSLFLVVLTGVFAGQGMALQFSIELADFGSKNYLGRLMVIAILRELGPVLAGLMIASRCAAGITAEIGAMVSSEQIDALRAFGVDPIRKLAVPRFIALLVMVPALTIVCDFVAITGGWVIAVFVAHISSTAYWTNVFAKLSLGNVFIGLSKPFLFAGIIAVISNYLGFATSGGTRGVGRATTQSVVGSAITILFVNFLFTRLVVPNIKGFL